LGAFILTRINVGDYDEWKPMFDQDRPKTREKAWEYRIFRSVDDPAEVFLQIEFDSVDDAREAQQRLLESGVLDRFPDKSGPTVAEAVERIRPHRVWHIEHCPH
jgi:hypothetical protein